MPFRRFPRLPGLLTGILLAVTGHSALSQTAFYIPKSLITPVHTHRGELHVSLGRGGGYDANVSYAVSDRLAAFATGTLKQQTEGITSIPASNGYARTRDDYALKWGIGVFRPTRSRLVHLLESYAGVGITKADNHTFRRDRPELGKSFTESRSWNVFWQFNASSKFGRGEFTAAVRFAYFRYPHLRAWKTYMGGDTYNYQNLGFATVDPVISQSIVFGRFKMNLQYGLSVLLKEARATEVRTRPAPGGPLLTAQKVPVTHLMGAVLFRVGLQYNFDLRKAGK
jgi:hypothetical protein